MLATVRIISVGIGLLLVAAAAPLCAQAVGTPEHYVKEGQEAFAARSYSIAATSFRQASMLEPDNGEYHFLLASALASDGRWDEARESFARAATLRPELQAAVDEWLATQPAPAAPPARILPRPPARPGAPAPVPAPAPTPRPRPAPVRPAPAGPPARPARPAPPAAGDAAERPAGAFAVGDPVEIQYRAGEWVPGVVTAVDAGACAYYRVRADPYGNGNPSNLGYFCGSVRAPTGVAQPVAECGGSNPNCAPTAPPPLGTYLCSEQVWQGPGKMPQYQPRYHGPVTLLGGNRYRMFDDGAVGRYQYDATSHRVRWTGGDLGSRGGVATYGLDGTTPEITIVFETDYTRRTGNRAPEWQCSLGR